MGDFLILERFKWFDYQVRRNRFPGHSHAAPVNPGTRFWKKHSAFSREPTR